MAFATSTSLLADSETSDSKIVNTSELALQFENPETEPEWRAVNDDVMGGLSQGQAGNEGRGARLFGGSLLGK